MSWEAACITVLQPHRSGIPEEIPEKWRPAFSDVEVVLSTDWRLPGRDRLEKWLGYPVRDLSMLISTDSTEDRWLFQKSYYEAARIARALTDVYVNEASLAYAIATHSLSALHREFASCLSFAQALADGFTEIGLLGHPQSVAVWALLRRAVGSGSSIVAIHELKETRSRLARIDASQLLGLGEGVPDVHITESSSAVVDLADPWLSFPANIDDLAGGVMVVHASTNPFYLTHTLPILRELRGAAPTMALVVPPAEPEALREAIDPDHMLIARPLAAPADPELEPISEDIRTRLRDLCSGSDQTDSWIPSALARMDPTLSRWVGVAVSTCALVTQAIRRLAPRSVWLPTGRTSAEDFALQAAHRNGSPAVTGFAGLISDEFRNLAVMRTDAYVTIYGEQAAEAISSRFSVRHEAIRLVGAPNLDPIYKIDQDTSRMLVRSALHIPHSEEIIAIMTSRVDGSAEDEWLTSLASWAEARGDVALVIRPHPARRHEYDLVRSLFQDIAPKQVRWWEEGELEDLVAASLAVLTDKSTSGLSAVIMRKPLIQVNMTGSSYDYAAYAEEGLAMAASSTSELVTLLDRLLEREGPPPTIDPDARERFARRYNYGDDGQAARRIAQLLTRPPPPFIAYENPLLSSSIPDPGLARATIEIPRIVHRDR